MDKVVIIENYLPVKKGCFRIFKHKGGGAITTLGHYHYASLCPIGLKEHSQKGRPRRYSERLFLD